MGKTDNQTPADYVKKQTLIMAVAVSLLTGFIGGAVYSSFRLSSQTPQMTQGNAPHDTAVADRSAEVGAKILELEKYIKENPKDSDAWTQLGNLFFDSDRYEDSIKAYAKSLEIAPSNPPVLTDMGVMYRRNKQPRKAVEAFDLAIKADPSFEMAYFNKFIVLHRDLNDFQGAVKALEDLVQMNPVALAPDGEPVDALIKRMKSQLQKQ